MSFNADNAISLVVGSIVVVIPLINKHLAIYFLFSFYLLFFFSLVFALSKVLFLFNI